MVADMLHLLCIDISLHFKVVDAAIYGGKDSVGYASLKLGNCGNEMAIRLLTDRAALDNTCGLQAKLIADKLGVPPENVTVISKAEYDEATEDDDEDTDEEDFDDEDY